jgi:hypothetical protein
VKWIEEVLMKRLEEKVSEASSDIKTSEASGETD